MSEKVTIVASQNGSALDSVEGVRLWDNEDAVDAVESILTFGIQETAARRRAASQAVADLRRDKQATVGSIRLVVR